MSSRFYCALCRSRNCTGNRLVVNQDPNHKNFKELRKALYDLAEYAPEEIEALFQHHKRKVICAGHVPNYQRVRVTKPRINRHLPRGKLGRRPKEVQESLQSSNQWSDSDTEEPPCIDDNGKEPSPPMNVFPLKQEIETNSDNEGIADVDQPGETYFLVKGSSVLELATMSNVCPVCNSPMVITLRNVDAVPVVDVFCEICKAIRETWDGSAESEPCPQLEREDI